MDTTDFFIVWTKLLNILSKNIFYCLLQKRESPTGIKRHKADLFLGELPVSFLISACEESVPPVWRRTLPITERKKIAE